MDSEQALGKERRVMQTSIQISGVYVTLENVQEKICKPKDFVACSPLRKKAMEPVGSSSLALWN